jgi:putative hydrolase of the HAD superfamily
LERDIFFDALFIFGEKIMLRVISFDVDGTLVDLRFNELIWNEGIPLLYAEKMGIGLEEARKHVKQEYDRVGENRLEWYDIRYWFRYFGLEGWRELLKSYEVTIYPEVPWVLNTLTKKYDLIAATNLTREFLDMEMKDLRNFFKHVFSSTSDFKQVKKTIGFYSKICDILQIKPQEMVHVGDHPIFDYEVPRKLSITAYYLDRTGSTHVKYTIKDLKEFEDRIL